jgi:hypothetical protein
MEYIKVLWKGMGITQPAVIFMEVGPDRVERRRVERYADGRTTLAGPRFAEGETELCDGVTPSVAEIDADPEFVAVRIGRLEFEQAWNEGLK